MFVFKDLAFKFKTNLRFELPRIYGIGYQRASKVADLIGLSRYFTTDNMNYFFFEVSSILFKLYYFTDDRLRFLIKQQIRRLLEIKSIKGLRLSRGLPVRGQRTHSNCKQNKYHLRNEVSL